MTQHHFAIVSSALVWVSSLSGLGVHWLAEAVAGQLSPPEQALVLAGCDGWQVAFARAPHHPIVAVGHGRAASSARLRQDAAASRMTFMEVRVEHDIDGYVEAAPVPARLALVVRPEWEAADRAVMRALLALSDLGVIVPCPPEEKA